MHAGTSLSATDALRSVGLRSQEVACWSSPVLPPASIFPGPVKPFSLFSYLRSHPQLYLRITREPGNILAWAQSRGRGGLGGGSGVGHF